MNIPVIDPKSGRIVRILSLPGGSMHGMSTRAYDLLGDVSEPAEIFPRLRALESMAASLRARGLDDAASETLHLLEEARAFEQILRARSGRLSRLWKALEMEDSPHTPAAEARKTILEAALSYRAVREQGTPRPRQECRNTRLRSEP